jgi:hypothetical protein
MSDDTQPPVIAKRKRGRPPKAKALAVAIVDDMLAAKKSAQEINNADDLQNLSPESFEKVLDDWQHLLFNPTEFAELKQWQFKILEKKRPWLFETNEKPEPKATTEPESEPQHGMPKSVRNQQQLANLLQAYFGGRFSGFTVNQKYISEWVRGAGYASKRPEIPAPAWMTNSVNQVAPWLPWFERVIIPQCPVGSGTSLAQRASDAENEMKIHRAATAMRERLVAEGKDKSVVVFNAHIDRLGETVRQSIIENVERETQSAFTQAIKAIPDLADDVRQSLLGLVMKCSRDATDAIIGDLAQAVSEAHEPETPGEVEGI